ncbi:MAG: DUF5054 domain-containing protein [Terrimicrobiaceae bacterium]
MKALQSSKAHHLEAGQRLASLTPRWISHKGFSPVTKRPAWIKDGLLGPGRPGSPALSWDFIYEAFGSEDYETFKKEYVVPAYLASFWAVPDFTKPGLETVIRKRRRFGGRMQKVWHRNTREGDVWLIELSLPKIATERYGAPRDIQVQLRHRADGTTSLELYYREKDAFRGAEALWLRFRPLVAKGTSWHFHKMGEWIAANEVCKGGGGQLHGLDRGVALRSKGGAGLLLESLDAPLVGPGIPNLLGFKSALPSASEGVSFNLFNNTWTTNFPMWNGDDGKFRFQLAQLPPLISES